MSKPPKPKNPNKKKKKIPLGKIVKIVPKELDEEANARIYAFCPYTSTSGTVYC